VQLLGGKPEPLAANAAKAVELGALGVDLNFGCPAKTVNRHDGGATLLQYPDRIYSLVSAVRRTVPAHIPVTAKIRLGFEDTANCLANAQAIEAAGATWLTVHCRTKTDGYRPPAYWEWMPKIREASSIRLVTNGEIWNVSDFRNVRKVAGTLDYMIGRGVLRDPFLFKKIKADDARLSRYDEIKKLLPDFYRASSTYRNPAFAVARTKGWLKQLAFTAPEFENLFENLKVITQPQPFQEQLESI
jgi:tRNA-dihydrouridine synthase C